MSAFKEGFGTFVRLNGASLGAQAGAEYVENVQAEIDKLVKAINSPKRKIDKTEIAHLKGFAAEWWHAGTFNIDAAVKGVKTRAAAPDNNSIVDVYLSSGEVYSLKFCKSGSASAKGQAMTIFERYMKYQYDHKGTKPPMSLQEYIEKNYPLNSDPLNPIYFGQGRLIPTDQLKEAEKWLKVKIAKEASNRPEQVKRYQEALDKLTDRLKSNDGAQSTPLSEEESRELAKLAKEAGFDPAEWGITTEELITAEYIMKEAFKSGLSAALVSIILQTAPRICEIICQLIKEGKVDPKEFKELGFAALKGGTEGFLRGTVAAAITTACKSGALGAPLKALNSSVIGAVTAIALNTVQYSVLMAFGRMSKHEFANKCAEDLIITVCSLGFGAAGAAAATAMFTPAAAVFGYMVGSFIGSVIGGFVYKGVYSCVIAFCIESGSTFFGLVDQNYSLPSEVLKEIGLEVFEDKYNEPEWFIDQYNEPEWFEDKFNQPEQISFTFLRRGVIGVGKIGYI